MVTGIAEAGLVLISKAILDRIAKQLAEVAVPDGRIAQVLRRDPPQLATKVALGNALAALARDHPELREQYFDQVFLEGPGASILAKCVPPAQSPTGVELATAWAHHLGLRDEPGKRWIAAVTGAADDFLTRFTTELRHQGPFRPLFDSRAQDQSTTAVEALVARLDQFTQDLFDRLDAAPLPLARHIISSRLICDQLTREYVGRGFVFSALDERLRHSGLRSGYILIRGEPGIGKSSLMAQLVRTRGYVHHFNIAADDIRSPRKFLFNVCAQLIVRYDLHHHPHMDPVETKGTAFLVELLEEAAERAAAIGTGPVVVLVDALDEAEPARRHEAVNRLGLPRRLPDGVFVVVTIRTGVDDHLDVDRRADDIVIGHLDPENQADIVAYVRGYVHDHAHQMAPRLSEWEVAEDAFVDVVREHSAGNFMYVVHVLPDIVRGRITRATIGALEQLPTGLENYYRRHWRMMRSEDRDRFAGYQVPVLCLLAVAREPVTAERLAGLANSLPDRRLELTVPDVSGVLEEWREFLQPPGDPPTFRFYHQSFADFLDRSQGLGRYRRASVAYDLDKIDW